MILRFLFALLLISSISCSKKEEIIYDPNSIMDPYELYKEGLAAFEQNQFFFAHKKFSEAELNFKIVDLSAKSAIMSSFSLYGLSFYRQAEESLQRFIKNYPSDKNTIYANYLLAIIYYEQIDDEKKDIQPLMKANKQIDIFIKKYPETDYASDLKFKKNLIQNQLAAKEMYIAKYYINVQKWVPAINRLKNIVSNYDNTIFIEEALHRLVEIHYHLGLEKEAKVYANILGYNYNSSLWFEQSYKIINKQYKIKKKVNKNAKKTKKKDQGFVKKIIEMIK